MPDEQTQPIVVDRREIRWEMVGPASPIAEMLQMMSGAVKQAEGEGFRFVELEHNMSSRFFQVVMTRRVDSPPGGHDGQ